MFFSLISSKFLIISDNFISFFKSSKLSKRCSTSILVILFSSISSKAYSTHLQITSDSFSISLIFLFQI